MATIHHIRLARISPAFARECEREHARPEPGHAYGAAADERPDPYTRRSNICPVCHIAKSTGEGICFC